MKKFGLILQDGAGFGDVGVKGFDNDGVLLVDDAALELEGEGEGAGVEGEIFREQSKAFDGFVLREMDGETLDLGVDQRVHPGVGGQSGVGCELDSLVGGFGGNGGGDRKSTRLNSSHQIISYAVFCLKKKKT